MVRIVTIFILLIYILISIFLNRFNKLLYGKGTAICFIPIANIYLLGKLAVNKTVGWILVVCILSTAKCTITINNIETTYQLFPEDVNSVIMKIIGCLVLVLLIYGIKKYFEIKRLKETSINLEK